MPSLTVGLLTRHAWALRRIVCARFHSITCAKLLPTRIKMILRFTCTSPNNQQKSPLASKNMDELRSLCCGPRDSCHAESNSFIRKDGRDGVCLSDDGKESW